MMNKPTIDELLGEVDSKYSLIILASKRARQIVDEFPDETKSGEINPVSMALNEISEGKINVQVDTQINMNDTVEMELIG